MNFKKKEKKDSVGELIFLYTQQIAIYKIIQNKIFLDIFFIFVIF